jgi:hypothetical protein
MWVVQIVGRHTQASGDLRIGIAKLARQPPDRTKFAFVAGLFNALYIHPGGKCESTVQQLGKTCEPA